MKASAYKVNWPLRAATVLGCLVLITASLLSGFYAKFSTTDMAEDSARVAEFKITDDLGTQVQTVETKLAPGDSKEYTVTVTSSSEVAVRYTLVAIRETENLPIEATWTNATGTIDPNDNQAKTATLTITWLAGENDPKYSTEIDLITVKLTAEQID